MRNKSMWIFNAGNSFAGNPKWLFEYIVRHRKDITPIWMCYGRKTLQYVRNLGYKAELYASSAGKKVMQKAGVYVVEMCKEVFQPELEGIVILNLWHGVGCKSIERKIRSNITTGSLTERIAKKYIQNNDYFCNNQIFLVTSELMEKHFKEQCGIDDDKVIRGGYPRCIVTDDVSTYDHDIRREKRLDTDYQMAVYAPTFRDCNGESFIKTALPDIERLIQTLKDHKILLILKMHPLIEEDSSFLALKKTYASCPYLYFWDNQNDIYEIFSDIDIAIVDYSSIFYDLLARGVKKFIRYFFDIDQKENLRDFVFDVREMTCGKEAGNFEELLAAIEDCEETSPAERQRIQDLFWGYSNEDSCETIIDNALSFTPEDRSFPKLYSFDIFDTLISRKCQWPTTIFECVQKKIESTNFSCTTYFCRNFTWIRRWCESNVREFYKQSVLLRNDDHLEIQLQEIYDKMGELFQLTEEQKAQLLAWECEAELDSVIPLPANIQKLKEVREQGNDVVLISDMYLPKKVIQEMLHKADPLLSEIPLYLSSESGHQKTTKKLFLEVYDSLDYRYSEWIHIGDNLFADQRQPEMLGITTELIETPELSPYEKRFGNFSNDYGMRSVMKLLVNFRLQERSDKEIFAYQYASLYLVPYVHWAVMDAYERGYETLYFISRDGHYLKLIADAVIESKNLPVRTKYIYGSRKAWRVPSFLEEVDEEFFEKYGNFGGVSNFKKLLEELCLDEAGFDCFFPELAYVKEIPKYYEEQRDILRESIRVSKAYREYLLEYAKESRGIVTEYLQQEIDFSEKFAFIEYWGRGYTQDCLTRLLHAAAGREVDAPMYYVRSIYPSMGHSIRYNYTCNPHSVVFVESIFSNLSYKTITGYQREGGTIRPIMESCDNDMEMQECLERYLPEFARDFCGLSLEDEVSTGHYLYDFSMSYFNPRNTRDPILLHVFGSLKDAVVLGERAEEYAPPITFRTIIDWMHGKSYHTKSVEMSMKKSSWIFRVIYKSYAYYCTNIRDGIFRRKKRS